MKDLCILIYINNTKIRKNRKLQRNSIKGITKKENFYSYDKNQHNFKFFGFTSPLLK